MVLHPPVVQERPRQPKPQLSLLPFERPAKRCPQVIMLSLQLLRPSAQRQFTKFWLSRLGHGKEVIGMPLAYRLSFTARLQLLQRKLADRFEYAKARLNFVLNQALVEQGFKTIDY